MYLMGIDIGTSSCKVTIFDKYGNIIKSGAGEYPVYYPYPGWAEQNPDEWWKTVSETIRDMMIDKSIDPSKIEGIGIDGQSWSAVAVDETGEVLCNTPIWMDTRAAAICEEFNSEIGKDRIFHVSGNSLQPSYTTPKIIWYQRTMPDIYQRIHMILQSNGYIAYKLTGEMTMDVSQGYGLHCFDMKTATWDSKMCDLFGIPEEILPPIFPCHQVIGTVTEQASRETGLMVGTKVVAGGLDAACGTLGTGVIHNGETQEQGGQAGGMSICTDTYKADERLILSYHVVPGRWLLQGGTTGGGGVMRWLEKEFGDFERIEGVRRNKSSLTLMNEIAAAVPAGSEGMVFLPYMAGERSPIWDPDAKGVYYGLDFSKKKGHFVRAAMEGCAYALKHNLDIAQEAGAEVHVLRAMGGSANSLLWTQIKSDITGKPVVVPSSDTATTLGAAILAGVGTGVYKSFEEAVELTVTNQREHFPDMNLEKVYGKNYEVYLSLYEQLKGIMKHNTDKRQG